MEVSRVGVHGSVATAFPPERLVAALADVEATVAAIGEPSSGGDDERDGTADATGGGFGDDVVRDGDDIVRVDDASDAGDALSVRDCDAVVTFGHHDALLSGPAWVHSVLAGVDRFPRSAYERADVALTNSTGIHGTTVGETAVGYMLTLARRLHDYAAAQQRRDWDPAAWDEPFTLAGETVCVVGLGTLGRAIATRAGALGMSVTGVRRSGDPTPVADRVYGPGQLREAVAGARFVALAVPLTEETRGLVDAETLAAMRSDAYLVNVARGAVVDEAALVDALREGAIAGAALDVFETEPLPPESPLWDVDDVVVTPHRSSLSGDYFRAVAGIVRDNLRRIRAGESLTNRVV